MHANDGNYLAFAFVHEPVLVDKIGQLSSEEPHVGSVAAQVTQYFRTHDQSQIGDILALQALPPSKLKSDVFQT
jgi:hypothetical protein